MAEWSLVIGAETSISSRHIFWDSLSGLIDSDLVAGGGTAYLRSVNLSTSRSLLATSLTKNQSQYLEGPSLTSALEGHSSAITISAGGESITVSGPDATGNVSRDSTEPYYWRPSSAEQAAIRTFAAAYKNLSTSDKQKTTITLSDGLTPTEVEISSSGDITEGSDAVFRVTRSRAASTPLTVNVQVTETRSAISGTAPTTITIPANQTSADLTIPTRTDALSPGQTSTITARIQMGSGYTVGTTATAMLMVANYVPPPTVTIAAQSARIAEGRDVIFTVTATSSRPIDTRVNVQVTETGDMIAGTAPTAITIPANQTSANLTVSTTDDNIDEPDSTITARIQMGSGYTVGATASATTIVADDEIGATEPLRTPHITAVPLVDIPLHGATGTKHIYASNRDITIGGKRHLDILAKNGISNISHSIDGVGGIATISSATVRLLNSAGGATLSRALDAYDPVGRVVRIRYLFPPSSTPITVYSGKVSQVHVRGDVIELSLASITRDDIAPVPAQTANIAKYPNIAARDVGKSLPLVFGNLDAADKLVLAPTLETDFLTRERLSSLQSRTYGDVYYYDEQDGKVYMVGATKSGDRFVPGYSQTVTGNIYRQVSISFDEYVITPNPPAKEQTVARPAGVSLTRVEFAGTLRVNGYGGYGYSRTYTRGNVQVSIYRGNTRVYHPAQFRINKNNVTTVTETFSYTDAHPGSSGDYRIVHAPSQLGSQYNRIDREYYRHITDLVVQVTFHYSSTKIIPTQARFFQSIAGFEDQAAHYADGGVVRQAGETLSHPVDIVHALLRERKHGMNTPTAQVDRSDIDYQRTLVHERYKFDFALSEQIGFDSFSDLVRQGTLSMRQGTNGGWEIRAAKGGSGPVGIFTHTWNILNGSFSHSSTPLRDIKNHFFLRYGYSHITESYTQTLVRSGQRNGAGFGNLTNAGKFFASKAVSVVAAGDRMLYNDRYYIVTKVSSKTAWEVRRENGGPIGSGQNLPYEIGPAFDRICYDSEKKYGQKPYLGSAGVALESRYIQDHATARAYLHHLINHYAHATDVVQFASPLNEISRQVGDEIIVDHPNIQGIEKVGTLSASLSASASSVMWSLDRGVKIHALDYLILQSDTHFEVVRSNGGTAIARGQLYSTARTWPPKTNIYRPKCVYIIERMIFAPGTNRINIRARKKSKHTQYDTPFPPQGLSGESPEPVPTSALMLDEGDPLLLDGDYVVLH